MPTPTSLFGWRRGHHGACEPFGIAATVAHSGPVRPGTFIHFDADRQWHTGDAETAESHLPTRQRSTSSGTCSASGTAQRLRR